MAFGCGLLLRESYKKRAAFRDRSSPIYGIYAIISELKKGAEAMNGILPLWKERGMTSHDCIFHLRRILKTRKIGHTGTLDPEVDGVLPICVGAATKAAEFMTDMGKAYEGEITLGYSTETEDAHGEIVERVAVLGAPETAIIDEMMTTLEGTIIQIPPMYSAVKVNGRRLYEYARKGETVERPKREAEIYSFVRTSEPRYNEVEKTVSWDFAVKCGKGTYIRTLAVDLGKGLGYPAHMSRLTRTASGPFSKENCLTLAEVQEKMDLGEIDSVLLPIESIFSEYPRFDVNSEVWEQIKNGSILPSQTFEGFENASLIAVHYQGYLVALYENHTNKPNFKKPRKMFLSNIG